MDKKEKILRLKLDYYKTMFIVFMAAAFTSIVGSATTDRLEFRLMFLFFVSVLGFLSLWTMKKHDKIHKDLIDYLLTLKK